MGFIKDAKSNIVGTEAAKARDAGRTVFTPRLNMPSSQPGLSGDIDTWGLMVQAIEAEGWTLAHWAVGVDTKGRGEAYPLFRR
jgi:hypothetical protein